MPAISNEALKYVQTPTDLRNVNNSFDPANNNPFPGGKGNPNTYPTLENELKWTQNKANLNPGASGTSVRYGNARPAGKAPPLSGVGSGNGFTSPMIEQGLKQTPAPTNPLPSSPATRPSTINQAVKNLPSLPSDLDSGLTKSGPIWQPARNAAGEAAEAAAKGAGAGARVLGGLKTVAGGIGGTIAEEAIFTRPAGNLEDGRFNELNRLAREQGKTPFVNMTPAEQERLIKQADRNLKGAEENILKNSEKGIKAIDDIIKSNPKPVEPKAPNRDDFKSPKMTPERERSLEIARRNAEANREALRDQSPYKFRDWVGGLPLYTPDGKLFDPLNPPKPKTGSPLNPDPYSPSNPYNPPTPENPPRPRPIAPPAPFDPTPTPNPPLTTPNDPFKPIAPPVPQDDKKLTPTPTDKPKINNPPVNNPGFGGVNLNWPISENLLSMKLDLSQIGEKQVQPRLDILQKKLGEDFQIKLDDQTGKLTKEIEKSTDEITTNQKEQTSLIITALTGLPALIGTALAPKFGEIISTLMPKFTELDNSINNNINQLPGKIINPVNKNTNMVGANLMNNTTSQSQLIQQQLHDTQANNLTALSTMTGQCNPACGSGSGGGNKPNSKETIKKVKFPNPTKDYNRPNPRNKWAVNAKPDMQELELKTDLDKMNYLIDAVNRLDQLFPIKEIVGGKFDKDLMAPTGLTGDRNIPIYNYFQLIEYMFRAWDKRIGAPAPIKIKDSDPLTPGSQPITVKPANLFEANNLIYKTSFDASRDIDLTNALATRTMLMTANCYKVVAQMYGYLEAILSDLGMETTEELLKLNLPCDPYAGKGEFAGDGKGFEFKVDGKFDSNKEQDIEDLAGAMLKPSQVPVKYIKKSDVTTLRHIVEGVGRFAATAAAANALPLNDIDKILKHRVKQEQLDTALAIRRGQLANGIGPIEKKQDK